MRRLTEIDLFRNLHVVSCMQEVIQMEITMYQMYAYSKKYQTPEIWLLYPINEEMRDHSEISFSSMDGVNVKLFFVDVAHIEESLTALRNMLL